MTCLPTGFGPNTLCVLAGAQVKPARAVFTRIQKYLEILLDSILATREFFSTMINIFLSIFSGTHSVSNATLTVQNEVQLHLNFPYIGIKVKLDYY